MAVRDVAPTRVIILGAGGRDFHNFNVVFRADPTYDVVAFTATQIPGIAQRTYPPALAGPRYPQGIPVHPQAELARLIRDLRADEVVFSYSDVSHAEVMHVASVALAAGAAFRLLSPQQTWLQASVPVVAVCAVRSGAGKSPASREVVRVLRGMGRRPVVVRHPMPYGALDMPAQRFASMDDLDRYGCTIEEREEYEPHLAEGVTVHAGVDYAAVLAAAQAEADMLVWDGGNNDVPFFRPDLLLVVADPLRAGDELSYHPGETCLRMADAVIINKVDAATPEQVATVAATIRAANPTAGIIRAASPVTIDRPDVVAGRRVVVVEDGPTTTHGGAATGAGYRAAIAHGATVVDPRPWAVGSIAAAYREYPHLGPVVPALGYNAAQRADLRATLEAVPCDAVVSATPIDLAGLLRLTRTVARVSYRLHVLDAPGLEGLLARFQA